MTTDIVRRPVGGGPGPLERSWNFRRVITDLAEGKMTQVEIARKYGVTQGAVSQFLERHGDAIMDKRAHLADEFHGMWIADKVARVGALQEQAEGAAELMAMALGLVREAAARGVTVGQMLELAEGGDPDGASGSDLTRLETEQDKIANTAMTNFLKLQKSQREAMRNVAEELAQLPNRPTVQITTERIEHVYVGVDMDDV